MVLPLKYRIISIFYIDIKYRNSPNAIKGNLFLLNLPYSFLIFHEQALGCKTKCISVGCSAIAVNQIYSDNQKNNSFVG